MVDSRTAPFAALLLRLALGVMFIAHSLLKILDGWVFSTQGGGWEYPVFWAVVMVVQALLGEGAYALKPSVDTAAVSRQA